jgi:hypothetical protein
LKVKPVASLRIRGEREREKKEPSLVAWQAPRRTGADSICVSRRGSSSSSFFVL